MDPFIVVSCKVGESKGIWDRYCYFSGLRGCFFRKNRDAIIARLGFIMETNWV